MVLPLLLLGILIARSQEDENAEDEPGPPVAPAEGEAPAEPPAEGEQPEPIPVEPVEPLPPAEPMPEPLDPDDPGVLPEPLPERDEDDPDQPVTEGDLLVPVTPGLGPGFGLGDPWAGQPDLFDDLELDDPVRPAAAGARLFEPVPFDRNVVRSELLPTVFTDRLERQGFRFGVGAQVSYDSNIFLTEEDEVSDFIFTLSPSVEYRSAPPGVPGQATFQYTPFLRLYLDESDLNTIDHAANGSVAYTGARGAVTATGSYGRFSNSNRTVGGLVETESFAGGIEASYQIGARTTIEAIARANFSQDSGRSGAGGGLGGGSSDSDTWSAQITAFWQATTRTRIGPSLRYSSSSADTTGDRQALAGLVVAEYQPRDELSFNGALGIEHVSGDEFSGEDSTSPTWNIGVAYQPNDRFALEGDLRYQAIPQGGNRFGRSGGGSQSLTGSFALRYTPNPDWIFEGGISAESFPSADSGNYTIGEQALTASVTRILPSGSLSLDGEIGQSNYEDVGAVTASRGDENFWSLALRYRRPILAERANLNATLQWSETSGDRSWERFQAALGVDVAF